VCSVVLNAFESEAIREAQRFFQKKSLLTQTAFADFASFFFKK